MSDTVPIVAARRVPPEMSPTAEEAARAATLELLQERAADATVCPSEVARALTTTDHASANWREAMPTVHRAVDRLLDEGVIVLSWKGERLFVREGPYRIGRDAGGRADG